MRGYTGSTDEWLRQTQWMRRLARSLVVDDSAADDLTQDAWVAALHKPPLADRPLRPWFGRVVTNLARNAKRGDDRRKAREKAAWSERAAPAAADVAAELELQRLLLETVEALDEPFRSTLVRAYMHGKSAREIADEDGVAEGTIRWRVHRALSDLRARLDDRHGGSRSNWSVLLLPLADRAPHVAPTGMAAVAATVLAMHIWTKLALVAGALVLGVWFVQRDPADPSTTLANAVEAPAPKLDLDEVAGTQSTRAALGASPESTPEESPVAATEVPFGPLPLPPAVIEAQLVDAQGVAVAGSRLTCTDRVSSREITLEEATFAVASNVGLVRLEVTRAEEPRNRGRNKSTPQDMWSVTVEASGPAHANEQRKVDVRAGQTAQLGLITLQPGGHIAGRVVDESGSGLADVEVGIVLPSLSLEERDRVPTSGLSAKSRKYRARTIDDGTFALRGLAVGFYRAALRSAGRLGVISDVFEVRPGEISNLPVLVALENTNVVTGTVIGLDGKAVSASVKYCQPSPERAENSWSEDRTERDATFRIEPVGDLPLDIYASRAGRDGVGAGDVLLRRVPCGSHGIVLQLEPPKFLTLRVVDTAGNAVSDYTPMILDDGRSGEGRHVATAEPQRLRVLGMPFWIQVNKAGCSPVEVGPIDPDRMPEELKITLRDVASVSGRVTSAGEPVPNAEVMLALLAAPDDEKLVNGFPVRAMLQGDTARTAADGTFRVPIQGRGRYRVMARRAAVAWTESAEMNLDPDRAVESVDLDFDARGSLAGQVRGFDGGANEARWVTASRGTHWVRSVAIAGDGSYRIDDLVPGEWMVMVSREDMSAVTRLSPRGTKEPSMRTTQIGSGRTTRQELEWIAPVRFDFSGSLHVGDSDMRTWCVAVEDPARPYPKLEAALAKGGGWRLTLTQSGSIHLRFACGPSPTRADAIDIDDSAAESTPGPRLELVTGSLVLEGDWPREVVLTCSLTGTAVWTTRVRFAGDAERRIDGLPVGRYSIRAGEKELAVVDVRAAGLERVAPRGESRER